MLVTVIVPIVSWQRYVSLFKTIRSIQAGTYKKVHIVVVVDGDADLRQTMIVTSKHIRLENVSFILNSKRMDWVYCQNRVLKEFESDFYICASDDFIFPATGIERAMKVMRDRFPDGDGVVTLWKRNNAVIGLIGRKLVEHFPNRQIYCPDYIHYCADWEFVWYLKRSKKLANFLKGRPPVKHVNNGRDETHDFSVQARKKDAQMREDRLLKGYAWGKNFNLITSK